MTSTYANHHTIDLCPRELLVAAIKKALAGYNRPVHRIDAEFDAATNGVCVKIGFIGPHAGFIDGLTVSWPIAELEPDVDPSSRQKIRHDCYCTCHHKRDDPSWLCAAHDPEKNP